MSRKAKTLPAAPADWTVADRAKVRKLLFDALIQLGCCYQGVSLPSETLSVAEQIASQLGPGLSRAEQRAVDELLYDTDADTGDE